MPRPSKEWEKKYGKQAQAKQAKLTGSDNVLSAAEKLAAGVPEAQAIVLMAIRRLPEIDRVMRLLDMDEMQMYGSKIVAAYHGWACNDYTTLMDGVKNRDSSLVAFIKDK